MELYVDGKLLGSQTHSGAIRNAPYQVILGKSAELRDSHLGYMCHATLDKVRIFDRVVSVEDLQVPPDDLKEHALLWLDFETAEKEGSYYSIGIPGRTYGLVWPDRSIQPELWQMKKSPQPVHFSMKDTEAGMVEITNRHHFRNLKELSFRWALSVDGKTQQEGPLEIALEPGETQQLAVPYTVPELDRGSECHLLISAATLRDYPWAKAGHEVAWEQFEIPAGIRPYQGRTVAENEAGKTLQVEEEETALRIQGEGFVYTFSRESGELLSMLVGDKELISKGPRFNVWRAPLANDLDSWNFWQTDMGYVREDMGRETANGWRSIGLDRLVQDVDRMWSESTPDMVRVHVETSMHAMNYTTGFKVRYDYCIYADGEMEIAVKASARGNMTRWIPRVGLQMKLPKEFQSMSWFGRGPFENYPDRKSGAKIGIYKSTVEEDYVPYIIPQDYGNRCDVRWFSLDNGSGSGLHISSGELFQVSAQKYSTDRLDRAHYTFLLEEEEVVTLNLDHRVSGVGGTANSVLNPYQLAPGEFAFDFRIRPY
jgi:beta-galactosidase